MSAGAPSVLVLAGTGEARTLVVALRAWGAVTPIAALAGATERPALYPCETVVGGFGGVDGMVRLLRSREIAAVVDATHPFAAQISAAARLATRLVEIPLLAWARPSWRDAPDAADARWVDRLEEAVAALPPGARALSTVGLRAADVFDRRRDVAFFARGIERPKTPLSDHIRLILARPPFSEAEEAETVARHGITDLIAKDSGTEEGLTKLRAAGAAGARIWLLRRPAPPADPPDARCADVEGAIAALSALLPSVAGAAGARSLDSGGGP